MLQCRLSSCRCRILRSFFIIRYALHHKQLKSRHADLCAVQAQESQPLPFVVELIKLGGKVKVLERGDPETGETKSISLYRSGADPVSLQDNNGKLAGRLYLKNVMVPGDIAMIEVDLPFGFWLVMHVFELSCLTKLYLAFKLASCIPAHRLCLFNLL